MVVNCAVHVCREEKMKVKFFEKVLHLSAGGDPDGRFSDLEDDINNFLAKHPHIQIRHLKLTSLAAPVGDMVTNYGIVAVLVYDE